MLTLHRAARADVLAAALAQLLGEPSADPFAPEIVAVPTRGMERWLAQTMSAVLGASPGRADGVCANVVFPTPHRLVTDAVAVASGIDPETDPWLPERAVWPLLDVVDEHLGEPWLAALAVYLGHREGDPLPDDAVRRERRLSIVRHLAGLFDQYALHRPEMLAEWAQGRNAGPAGQPLLARAAWQPELWRRLRARIGTPDPAARRSGGCERLRAEPSIVELPDRLALFGLTRLPAGQLQILRALAAGRAVHLFLLHPSPGLWQTLAASAAQAPQTPPSPRRRDDRTGDLVANRLLASWGRDVRETQLVLAATAQQGDGDELHPLPDEPPATLLARLQADIRADRPSAGVPLGETTDTRAALEADDHSLVIHSCHGRARQVEVLRDAILHALAQDETLEPRDVIVMCPDVENYAPLIQATFGNDPDHAVQVGADARHSSEARPPAARRIVDLRVRLADRSLTQTNPVLGVVATLLELVGRRITASEVLDLADRGPVRRRFGFDDDDLTRLQDWIAQSGIRWGLDAEHRAPYKLTAVRDGTWRAGLDRLLLGVTMTEDDQRLFADVLPLDDVDSRSIELAGRVTELVARLTTTLDTLGAGRTLAQWSRALGDAADALTASSPRDRWQRAELQRILDAMVAEAPSDERPQPELAPAEARAHLAGRLAGRPTRANFRTGHLTVCTLTPMRSVPHRVVCLLGLDDVAFPRRLRHDGDNLMLDEPYLGERDPRSEDRQLLLDAVLAATDRLIVTYSGNDERTNLNRPPAVPVGELLDAIDATVRCPGDPAARASERVLIRHPLQPFDPRNFQSGALAGDAPWSFDDIALRGAEALSGPRAPTPLFLSQPLSPVRDAEIDLEDLVAFVGNPVRSFLRRRLEMALYDDDDEVADALPIELDGLQRWAVANRLLEALLRGSSLRTAVAAEKVRGNLPPGVLGDRIVDSVRAAVLDIAAEVAKVVTPGADRDPIDVRVALAGGRALTGTVTGVNGDVLLSASYSRVSGKQRTAAWVRFLALVAGDPERPFSAVTIGRGPNRDVKICRLGWPDRTAAQRRAAAVAQLETLVDLYDRGLREPLPLFAKASTAWAEAARRGADPVPEATAQWETQYRRDLRIDGENLDPNHQLVFGGAPRLAQLLQRAPLPDESGDGWAATETTRVGRLARRLWDGLLDAEQSQSR